MTSFHNYIALEMSNRLNCSTKHGVYVRNLLLGNRSGMDSSLKT